MKGLLKGFFSLSLEPRHHQFQAWSVPVESVNVQQEDIFERRLKILCARYLKRC